MGTSTADSEGARPPSIAGRGRAALALGVAVALAVVLWGGYSHHWPWTGINGSTATLWDWLHLLLLPFAFAVLPVWMRLDTRVDDRSKQVGLGALGIFVLLVALGYLVPWAWTGFRGNTLWDWLSLVALPFAVVSAPRVRERRGHWTPRHTLIGSSLLVVFVGLVIGGYAGHWAWTGFTGNTLWNWLQLLLLPLLIPTVIVPALTPKVTSRIVYLDKHGRPLPLGEDGKPLPEPDEPDGPDGPGGPDGPEEPAPVAASAPAAAPAPAADPVV